MSLSPVIDLRKAMRNRLLGDSIFTARLGGAKVFDEAPPGTPFPYVTFGDTQQRDWSTSSGHGAEQVVTLNIWTNQNGMRDALDIADQLILLLDEAPLTLTQNRLIDLRFVASETRRLNDGKLSRVSVRLRATTESL